MIYSKHTNQLIAAFRAANNQFKMLSPYNKAIVVCDAAVMSANAAIITYGSWHFLKNIGESDGNSKLLLVNFAILPFVGGSAFGFRGAYRHVRAALKKNELSLG